MKPLSRVMYCITSRSGQFLCSVAPDGPVFSPMPSEALETRNAWMSSSVAASKALELSTLFPGVTLNIGLLELVSTGPGTWRVSSSRSFPFLNTKAELVA